VRIGNFSSVATNATFFLRANHHPEWVTVFTLPAMPWPADVARLICSTEIDKLRAETEG
jgi:hypothetical protein